MPLDITLIHELLTRLAKQTERMVEEMGYRSMTKIIARAACSAGTRETTFALEGWSTRTPPNHHKIAAHTFIATRTREFEALILELRRACPAFEHSRCGFDLSLYEPSDGVSRMSLKLHGIQLRGHDAPLSIPVTVEYLAGICSRLSAIPQPGTRRFLVTPGSPEIIADSPWQAFQIFAAIAAPDILDQPDTIATYLPLVTQVAGPAADDLRKEAFAHDA